MLNRRELLAFMAAGSACVWGFPQFAAAQAGNRKLRVALTRAPSALDPQFQDIFTNTQATLQIFQPLLGQNELGALVPYLATAWRMLDDLTWEITLRENVRFHDGTPFTADDVVFSFARVPNVPNAPGPFTANVRDITNIDIVDPQRIRFSLAKPDPLFSYKLCQVAILSRKIHANAVLADFNSGRVAIGTGPYRFASHQAEDHLHLTANPDYWGSRPDWNEVEIRYVVEPGSRIAALRADEVDLIDNVPVQDIATIAADPRLALYSQDAFLTGYLGLDTARDDTPFVTDHQGQKLAKNPLRDPRVRQALSLAIDRPGMVNRLLLGQGTPADQMAGLLVPDRAKDMPSLAFDPEKARKLMTEAGYPQGFKLTVHGPNGWFASDASVLQAIAQSFNRAGINTQVDILPTPVLINNIRQRAYSASLMFFNGPYALVALRFLAMTPDSAAGNGSSNYYQYSNPKLDALMQQALVTMSPDARAELVAQAMRELMEDMGLIPVFFAKTNWAGRVDRVRYQGNPMSRTSAFYAQRV